MTIDERLEKLTERQEALTQTVELMAIENRERDRQLDRIMGGIEKLTGAVEGLVSVVTIHERRIERLEGQQDA
jgi:hypothetical protein